MFLPSFPSSQNQSHIRLIILVVSKMAEKLVSSPQTMCGKGGYVTFWHHAPELGAG